MGKDRSMKKTIDTSRSGFSLLELIIVMVLIAILSSIGLTALQQSQANTINKDAIATLKLLRSAQRAYRLDTGGYLAGVNHTRINWAFKVQLPVAANRNWNYTVKATDGCCQADRNPIPPGGAIQFHINISEEEPVNGTCR